VSDLATRVLLLTRYESSVANRERFRLGADEVNSHVVIGGELGALRGHRISFVTRQKAERSIPEREPRRNTNRV
jgi:hypothetical protein